MYSAKMANEVYKAYLYVKMGGSIEGSLRDIETEVAVSEIWDYMSQFVPEGYENLRSFDRCVWPHSKRIALLERAMTK